MEKETFLKAPAKTQREVLFDDLQEIKGHLKVIKHGVHLSSFLGGFVAVFAACGGYGLINYLKKIGG